MKLKHKLGNEKRFAIDPTGELFSSASFHRGFIDGFEKARALASQGLIHLADESGCDEATAEDTYRDSAAFVADLGEEEV